MAAELIDRNLLLDQVRTDIHNTMKRKLITPITNPYYPRILEKLVQLRRFEKMLQSEPEYISVYVPERGQLKEENGLFVCPSCGRKMTRKENFCPSCGIQFMP